MVRVRGDTTSAPPAGAVGKTENLSHLLLSAKAFSKKLFIVSYIFHMQIKEQLNSIWASIDVQKDVQATKQPCFPVPYTLITVERPVAGNKRSIIPCVELKNIHGGYEIRRCTEILKPTSGEPIDLYLKRLKWELERKDILGETIL